MVNQQIVEVETDSEASTMDANLDLVVPEKLSEVLTDTMGYPSASCCLSKIQEQTKLSSTLQDSSLIVISDDVRLNFCFL